VSDPPSFRSRSFRHRILTFKRLAKALALHGQGGTARFDELVEEVPYLMRVNYGDDTKDVDDESRDLESYITKMQAALALRKQQQQQQQVEDGRTGGGGEEGCDAVGLRR
jgi:hypothetical protein